MNKGTSTLDILERSLYNLAPLRSMKKVFFELTVTPKKFSVNAIKSLIYIKKRKYSDEI
jgi:hypothetical protein